MLSQLTRHLPRLLPPLDKRYSPLSSPRRRQQRRPGIASLTTSVCSSQKNRIRVPLLAGTRSCTVHW